MNLLFNQIIFKKILKDNFSKIILLLSLLVFLKPNFAITSDEANYLGFSLKNILNENIFGSVYNFELYNIFFLYDLLSVSLINFFGIHATQFLGRIIIALLIYIGINKLFRIYFKFKLYQILIGITFYFSFVWTQSYFALANFTYQGFVPNALGMSLIPFIFYYLFREKLLKLIIFNSILFYVHFEMALLLTASIVLYFLLDFNKLKFQFIFKFLALNAMLLLPIIINIIFTYFDKGFISQSSTQIYLERSKHHFLSNIDINFFVHWLPGILLCIFNTIIFNFFLKKKFKKFVILTNAIFIITFLGFLVNTLPILENIFFFRMNALLFFLHLTIIPIILLQNCKIKDERILKLFIIFILSYAIFHQTKNSVKNYIDYFDKNIVKIINIIKINSKPEKININYSYFDNFELETNQPFYVEKKFIPHNFNSIVEWQNRINNKNDFKKKCESKLPINLIIYNKSEEKICGNIIYKNTKFIVSVYEN